jgi:ABC-2 type transport system permease protein
MPAGLRWFAEHQPFTVVIDALRGLLDGAASSRDVAAALAWCTVLAVLGWRLSVGQYARERAG